MFMNKLIAKNMVQMTMCINEQIRLKTLVGNKLGECSSFLICVTSWVNNNALQLLVENQVSVLLKGIKLKNFNV
jgi:hypothetical protein